MRASRLMADVSSNNPTVMENQYMAAGHRRIAIKATEGTAYINPNLHVWADRAHEDRLAVSYYHYGHPEGNNSQVEARHFWEAIRGLWRPGDTVSLDLELGLESMSVEAVVSYHNFFCAHLAVGSGHHSITYLPEYYYRMLAPRLITPESRFWIAAWSDKQPKVMSGHTLWAWQFTNGILGPDPHECAGIGQCDISRLTRRVAISDELRFRRRGRTILHPRGDHRVIKGR